MAGLRLQKPTYTTVSTSLRNLGMSAKLAASAFDPRDISSIHERTKKAAQARAQKIEDRLKELRLAQAKNLPVPSAQVPKVTSKSYIDPRLARAIANKLFDKGASSPETPSVSPVTTASSVSPVIGGRSFGVGGTGTIGGM